MALSAANDVASLCAIQSCCTYLAPLAREHSSPSHRSRQGFACGHAPAEMSIEAERQAAAGLLRGELPGSLMRGVRAGERGGEIGIALDAQQRGEDCGGDLSFHLRGFDGASQEARCAPRYAEHQPSRPADEAAAAVRDGGAAATSLLQAPSARSGRCAASLSSSAASSDGRRRASAAKACAVGMR